MTTTINKDKFNALRWALSRATEDMYVNLYDKSLVLDADKLEWVVNWSALGDTDPDAAIKFANDVKAAAQLCKTLNDMDLKLVWEDDENLKALLEADPAKAKQGWINYKQLILDELKALLDSDKPSFGYKLTRLLVAEIPTK